LTNLNSYDNLIVQTNKGHFTDYDSWKLDNNETECACDKCLEKTDEKTSFIGIGMFELLCEKCAENMQYCDSCDRVGEDEEFSYGQEICDGCCDLKADKLTDRD
jgi:hypothetical protein